MSETEPTPEEGPEYEVYQKTEGSIAKNEESKCETCLAENWKLWWSLALVGFILTATFGGLYGWTMIKTE